MKLNVLETSKKLKMSPHTIRYYTNLGLVPSLKYDEHGNRIFDGDALNWLLCARFLRESGMPIAQVKHYFSLCQQGDSTIQERFDILLKLQEQTEKEQKQLQRRADCINDKIEHCRRILTGQIPDDCNPLYWPSDLSD